MFYLNFIMSTTDEYDYLTDGVQAGFFTIRNSRRCLLFMVSISGRVKEDECFQLNFGFNMGFFWFYGCTSLIRSISSIITTWSQLELNYWSNERN